MAETKSTEITNMFASPPVANPAGKDSGRVRVKQGTLEVANGGFDDDGDIIRLCTIPTNARILHIWIANDDHDGGTQSLVNLGLCELGDADAAGTIVDEDAYATVITQFQAASGFVDLAFEARTIDNAGDAVWEDGGEASDPATMYEICLFQTATVSDDDDGGTVSYIVEYTID
jgi:hypothetical protein